ncbi:hypothetical protein [Chitinophaga tropicalis]|uniref:DUF928 domain-containing protein n=1 Tax=Chitinophaga tropicalis TaxID=2683588 RepID=A0A7K1UEF2_9BACT|nr:hypothetical protein [Chitinophaga tropicalis]MVT12650.1 hypothetical protein [Chitinophaga tropicalis]
MKTLFKVVALLLSLQVSAQVNMTVQLPPTGVMQKAQLWNLLLVSASQTNTQVRIALRVTDAKTNQPVFTGLSRVITLNKGAKQVQAADVTPVTYEYLRPVADRSPNGLLTAGAYLACYSVMLEKGDISSVAAEDCLPFSVEPVSPPLLNSPANQSTEESLLPQFTWLPPAPVNIFNDLNYEMLIVEVRKGQSAIEAIQQNIPVFRALHVKSPFVNYPLSATTLDTAKNYAWMVTANNGNQFSAQTDIWTFRVKGASPVKTAITGNPYVQLRRELDGELISCPGTLKVAYNNMMTDTIAAYEVISLDDQQRVLIKNTLKLTPGTNFIEIPLSGRKDLGEGKQYLFRLSNSRREYWQLKFVYTMSL